MRHEQRRKRALADRLVPDLAAGDLDSPLMDWEVLGHFDSKKRPVV